MMLKYGPLFSITLAFWKKNLGFCCIASKPSAVDSETNLCQTRSPCRVQLQGRSQHSCFPCSLCPIFPWLTNWRPWEEMIVQVNACNFNLYPFGFKKSCSSSESPPGHFETWSKPWGASCLFCKARARSGLAVSCLRRNVQATLVEQAAHSVCS